MCLSYEVRVQHVSVAQPSTSSVLYFKVLQLLKIPPRRWNVYSKPHTCASASICNVSGVSKVLVYPSGCQGMKH